MSSNTPISELIATLADKAASVLKRAEAAQRLGHHGELGVAALINALGDKASAVYYAARNSLLFIKLPEARAAMDYVNRYGFSKLTGLRFPLEDTSAQNHTLGFKASDYNLMQMDTIVRYLEGLDLRSNRSQAIRYALTFTTLALADETGHLDNGEELPGYVEKDDNN